MAGLDNLDSVPEPGAEEPARARRPDGLVEALAHARGPRDHGDRQGPAADGHDLEEAPPVVGQALDALRDHLAQRQRVEGRAVGARGDAVEPREDVHVVAHELLDEKRASLGLARGGARHPLRSVVGAIEQCESEALGFRVRERSHGDVERRGAIRPAIPDLLEERAGLRLFQPVGENVEDRGRVGRPHEIEEERRAVGVAPLGVVDVDDEGQLGRQGREKRAERREGPAAHEVRIGDGLRGDLPDARHPPQHGEHEGDGAHVGRQIERLPDLLEVHEVPAEGVDHAVDGLVGDRLALVRASAKHERLAPLDELVEEVLRHGGLAHAGSAGDADHEGLARADLPERPHGGRRAAARVRPAPSRARARRPAARSADRPGAVLAEESLQDLRPRGPSLGIAVEQRAAQRIEIGRNPFDALGRRRGVERRLHREDVRGRAHERRAPDEGLVEHDADAVPVRSRRRASPPAPARAPCTGPCPRSRPIRTPARVPDARSRSPPRSRG